MESMPLNILFVGLRGVPNGKRAADARLGAFIQVLSVRHHVTVLDPSVFEWFRILRCGFSSHVDVVHVYSAHYIQILYYWVLSRVIGAKLVYQYVEYRSGFNWNGPRRRSLPMSLYQRINGWLVDSFAVRLWDGCIPISEFLENQVKSVRPHLPCLRIPPLCDFEVFERNQLSSPVKGPYLLYCGSPDYQDVADVIAKAYGDSKMKDSRKLVMLVGTTFGYEELVAYYRHADLLLIPLKDEVSDIARFPNKVCEYCAAHGAIVATPYGEMSRFFRDGENAVVMSDYSVSALREKLDAIEEGAYNLEQIRKGAYSLGRQFFDMIVYQEPLEQFLSSLSRE